MRYDLACARNPTGATGVREEGYRLERSFDLFEKPFCCAFVLFGNEKEVF